MREDEERRVYLDSSVILKRYLKEDQSEKAAEIYLKAYAGEHVICFSLWNIGEVLGVLDRARRLRRLSKAEHTLTRTRFISEARRMIRLGVCRVLPLKTMVLKDAWSIVEAQHIYEADALQLASARMADADLFYTSDQTLHKIANKMGLNSVCL